MESESVESTQETEHKTELLQPLEESLSVTPSEELIKALGDTTSLPKSLWLTANQEIDVVVYCYKNRLSGEIHSITLESFNPNQVLREMQDQDNPVLDALGGEDLFSEHVIHSWWTVPSYKQLDRLREESSSFVRMVGDYVVNPVRLKQKIILYHLRKIDLLDPSTNEKVVLGYREDERSRSRLTEESEEVLSRLHPTLLDTIYTKYRAISSLG